MKALPFNILKSEDETFTFQRDREQYFYDSYHLHYEIQLSLIISGEGTLISGDFLGEFKSGDLFLLGSNVPHVFRCNRPYYEHKSMRAEMLTLFIHPNHFDKLSSIPEGQFLKKIMQQSLIGQYLTSEHTRKIRDRIEPITQKKGAEKLIDCLSILKLFSQDQHLKPLLKAGQLKVESEKEGKRMDDVLQFILTNFDSEIILDDIAAIANLTPGSFCRFFKKRTRKTLMEFVNDIRLNHAKTQLISTDQPVNRIAYGAGFKNMAHFNRQFRRTYNSTPTKYRRTRANS